jgi:hypothetical protein
MNDVGLLILDIIGVSLILVNTELTWLLLVLIFKLFTILLKYPNEGIVYLIILLLLII